MVNLNLDNNPQEHYLWQNGNIFQDLMSPTNGIPCPFICTMVLTTEEQMKSQGEANSRFLALDSRVNTSYAKYIPSPRVSTPSGKTPARGCCQIRRRSRATSTVSRCSARTTTT